MQISTEQLESILPCMMKWAKAKEKVILEYGIPLRPHYLEDAKSVGVRFPEKVWIYEVPQIPIPKHPILKLAVKATQLILPATAGLSLRYGIFIHSNYSDDRYIIVHELVHTMQCERLGGIYAYLKQYLWECIEIGYPKAPMEQEAARIASEVCGIQGVRD